MILQTATPTITRTITKPKRLPPPASSDANRPNSRIGRIGKETNNGLPGRTAHPHGRAAHIAARLPCPDGQTDAWRNGPAAVADRSRTGKRPGADDDGSQRNRAHRRSRDLRLLALLRLRR